MRHLKCAADPTRLMTLGVFRDAAMPHLDGLYTYACHLLRCADDADDAVEECYLRAFRDYDAIRAEDIKPWLDEDLAQRLPH